MDHGPPSRGERSGEGGGCAAVDPLCMLKTITTAAAASIRKRKPAIR
jgi:hypothetical protein